MSPAAPVWASGEQSTDIPVEQDAAKASGPPRTSPREAPLPTAPPAESANVADQAPNVGGPVAPPPSHHDWKRLLELLDAVLPETAEDLGMTVTHWEAAGRIPTSESKLLKAAVGGWALGAQLHQQNGGLSLRLTAAQPGRKTLLVREEPVNEGSLEVRAVSMLRDLSRGSASVKPAPTPMSPREIAPYASDGKAVLAVTGALVGAYVGFAVERTGSSDDVALVYPLMTLGAGVGVGVSMVIAQEWDMDVPKAWYLAAAAGWPTTAATLIAEGQALDEDSSRYGYGLIGTASGLALGTAALALGQIDNGDAVLVHSGALFGMLYGGLAQSFINPDSALLPSSGMGIGMGLGVLVAGAWATQQAAIPEERILFVDLGAVLGGMAGAALASPALVGEEISDMENRLWLTSVAIGSLGGGLLGYAFTDSPSSAKGSGHALRVSPYFAQLDLGQPEAPRASTFGVHAIW